MTAQPVPGQDAMDVGGGIAATRMSDGSTVFWRINPPNDQVAYLPPGAQAPADLQNGMAATVGADGAVHTYDINNPPPQFAGTAPSGSEPGRAAAGRPRGAAQPAPYGGQRYGPGGQPQPYTNGPGDLLDPTPNTTFPGGGFNQDAVRYFQGRPDFGGPLGWGEAFQDPGTGYTYLGGAPNVGGLQGLSPAGLNEPGRDRTYQPYYGGQPFQIGR